MGRPEPTHPPYRGPANRGQNHSLFWFGEHAPLLHPPSPSIHRAVGAVLCSEGPEAQLAAMGLTFTKLFARLFSKREMRILMVSWRPLARWMAPADGGTAVDAEGPGRPAARGPASPTRGWGEQRGRLGRGAGSWIGDSAGGPSGLVCDHEAGCAAGAPGQCRIGARGAVHVWGGRKGEGGWGWEAAAAPPPPPSHRPASHAEFAACCALAGGPGRCG